MIPRLSIAGFLIAHGLVHVFVWITKPTAAKEQPFDASHSWLLGSARGLAVPVAAAAMAILIAAGMVLLFQVGMWRPIAVVGLAASLFLNVVFFNPWLGFITVVNAALIYGIVARHWPASTTVGA